MDSDAAPWIDTARFTAAADWVKLFTGKGT
jgi:hypothetical protein